MIHLTALFGLLLFAVCYSFRGRRLSLPKGLPCLVFALALLLRLAAAACSGGFDNDTACFASWADRIFQAGPSRFYSADFFADYPPGYLYLLYPAGALRSLFGIGFLSPAHLILLRLPAILCDLGCGLLLYRVFLKKLRDGRALLFSCAFLFHPAVLLNSSVWGQTDAVYTLPVLLMCCFLAAENTLAACLSFSLGFLIKPQMLIFAPILLIGLSDRLRRAHFSRNMLARIFLQGLTSLLVWFALILPFGPTNVLGQYLRTVGSYPYAAVNACNLWGFFGLNWVSQDNTFLGLPYRFYGGAAIGAALVLVLYLSRRYRACSGKYALMAAFFMTSVFVFSVRMHERYLFPAVALLLLSCALLPSRGLYFCFAGFSLLHFYNTAQVLFFYDPYNYDRRAPLTVTVSALMLLLTAFFFRRLFGRPGMSGGFSDALFPDSGEAPSGFPGAVSFETGSKSRLFCPLPPRASRKSSPLTWRDLLCLLAVTAVYACFAFFDLGDRRAPSTALELTEGQTVELVFGTSKGPLEMAYYMGPKEKRSFALEILAVGGTDWETAGEILLDDVFTWQTVSLGASASGIRLTLEADSASLLELVFLGGDGQVLTPSNAAEYPCLFDEQDLYPESFSFRNSMYFDEIYHGRTAYEFLQGLPAYENTHPPFGKLLIAAGIAVFGMNPFGWRVAGTLFGIAMLPCIYLMARRMTESRSLSSLAAVLFAFDFMHFAQTRLATIDVFITFFVLLMYLLLYRYSTVSFYDTPLRKTFLPLGACGLCMGLGIATKWSGVYAGAGLALLFFATLARRYREYLFAAEHPDGSTDGISHRHILAVFPSHTLRTLLFCILFFVLVPLTVYTLSYLPFLDGSGDSLLPRMLRNQAAMFRYHSRLNATHDYSSPWYEWPLMKRPIWYYSRIVTGAYRQGGLREGISSFGNPLVWWAGIPASLIVLWRGARKKDSTAAFLFTGYLAQYLPWFFVSRITFIYHYFPSVPFVVLMCVYALNSLKARLSKRQLALLCALWGGAAFGLFLLFYPVLAGQPIEASFVARCLRWFSGWTLVAE